MRRALLRFTGIIILSAALIVLTASLTCAEILPNPSIQLPSLKVGVALPLSGDFAKFGVDIRRGMLLAQEELRETGVTVELLFEDTQYLPRLAVSAAHKLIEQSQVDVLVSLWDTAEAVAPITERAKVPHFSIRWNPRVAEDFSYTFTFESTYITWVGELIRLLQSEGARSVSLLTDSASPAWLMARASFLEQAAKQGLTIVKNVEFAGSSDDMRSAILKLISEPSDYLVMIQYEPTLGEAMRRLKELNVATPITGYFEGMDAIPNVEGRRFVAQFDTQAWFREKFARRFPHEHSIKAPFGYDLVMILGTLLKISPKKPTGEQILKHLRELKNYPGATGIISTNNSRNIETTCVRKIVKNGKSIPLF